MGSVAIGDNAVGNVAVGSVAVGYVAVFKRTKQSLHSFPFFIKERNDLCVLSRSL